MASERVEFLKARLRNTNPSISVERARLVTQFYRIPSIESPIMLAGYAFTSASLGISHCMAHPLGAMYHVPHGVGNAICLPVVMEFNMGAWPERYADIATFFGEDVSGLSVLDGARKGVECVYRLVEDLPIQPLEHWGVTLQSLDQLADEAMNGGDRPNNARMTNKEDFIRLYTKALTLKKQG